MLNPPPAFLKSPPGLGIVAAAFHGGQPKDGVDQAPEALIRAGLKQQLRDLGWDVHFDGRFQTFANELASATSNSHAKTNGSAKANGNAADVVDPPQGIVKNPLYVGGACASVAEQVEAYQRQGRLSLVLGGDHSLALGTIAGTSRAQRAAGRDFCVVWVDAHADINTVETTTSGNIHGMPVSFLMGLNKERVRGFEWVPTEKADVYLRPDQIVYIGLRDVDAGEKKILKEHKIKAYSMHDVDKYGIGKVVEMALDHVNAKRDKPIHLTFDVDGLDPSVAPATGTPVRGGLTFREGHYICEAIYETGLLVALDIMEVNPTLGDAAQHLQTIQVGCSLTRASLGETLL